MKRWFSEIPLILFILSTVTAAWVYGIFSYRNNLFPFPQVRSAVVQAGQGLDLIKHKTGIELPWYYMKRDDLTERAVFHDAAAMAPGLTLVTGIGANDRILAQVIDAHGREVYRWDISWFKLWPNPPHLEKKVIPKSEPGGHLHGVVLADNGDLVFNFEWLAMFRIDPCGKVKWRLPRRVNHSLTWDPASRTFWAVSMKHYDKTPPPYPNHGTPFLDFRLLEISPGGKVLRDIGVNDLLMSNGLHGLLYMSSISNWSTKVSNDTLHVNDVEPFPADMKPGMFKRGDILVSLRNINAILVFDLATRKIKYLTIGKVLRQHDPDFVDGNTISVFDNNNLRPMGTDLHSRIVQIDARDNSVRVVFQGTRKFPFFSDIMGKEQYLKNGNILITEAVKGRAIEITGDGRPVWEFHNIVKPGLVALIDEAQRLPARFDVKYFAEKKAMCRKH